MSDTEKPDSNQDVPVPDGGILAALPRSRPQRASARRTAARNGGGTSARATTLASRQTGGAKPARSSATTKEAAANEKPLVKKPVVGKKPSGGTKSGSTKAAVGAGASKKPAVSHKPSTAKKRATKPGIKPAEPPVPKQGYEPEEEFELGTTVNPPSGVELAESVADIVGELANSGLTAGGRLLKDAFSLLRRS